MCGIVGFFEKAGCKTQQALGAILLEMLTKLACRGPDSAGVAVYGPASKNQLIAKVKLGESGETAAQSKALSEHLRSISLKYSNYSTIGSYARFTFDERADISKLIDSIESLGPDFEVVSIGHNLEIVKQVGSPPNLEQTYGISKFAGTHGLGHTRLSTESRVDLSHSQPFWGHGLPDFAIVHNGHITNYHQLRRQYQQRGTRFYTENDSEVVALFLAQQLRGGKSLKEALEAMLRELDGSYSCLVATSSEFGFVKDPFALKPLLWAETDGFVAAANEEVAIRAAIPGAYEIREAQVKEVRVWQR